MYHTKCKMLVIGKTVYVTKDEEVYGNSVHAA